MKSCELCRRPARVHCEADQASLCWDCDEKVHSANFLVARHSRCSLCHACRAPTPWAASGAKIGWTFSVCKGCAARWSRERERRGGGEEEIQGGNNEEDEVDADAEDEDEDGDEDEVGDNQVVPLPSSTPPPPPTSSSSCSEGGFVGAPSSKRICEDADLDSDVCIHTNLIVLSSPAFFEIRCAISRSGEQIILNFIFLA